VSSSRAAPDIVSLDLSDRQVVENIKCIATSAGFSFSPEKLVSNLRDSSPKSVCLGAFVEGELAAINAFMAHEVLIDGRRYDAYQSGWSATLPEHQGKGLFRRIIGEAKRYLGEIGAPFIFGFPNSVSEPIFLKKLDFKRTPMCRVLLPTRPRLVQRLIVDFESYFRNLADPRIVRFNQYQNMLWKRTEHESIAVVEDYTNFLWGKVVDRKVPMIGTRKVLLAGGCELNKPQLLGQLLARTRREHGVEVVRFVVSDGSMLASASRFVLGGEKTEPLIHFELRDLPENMRFDAHVGLKDAY
jgi:hypothetical protein